VTEPALWTLSEAAAAIAAKKISSVELLDACLERIPVWQSVTNAFIDLRAAEARQQAVHADMAIARSGPRGPLHGIPLAHKDMFYRAGEVSTCGSGLRREWRADVTATVLSRLDASGAVDLGTLNMAEWAGGATGHNIWFGDACNPWSAVRVTGGSSSGPGAAVAARMVFGALGSDTGGSIRLPSTMCGVTGLKPTWGGISRFGAMPRAWTLDCIGPLARTARDCALIHAAITGPDPNDPTTANTPVFGVPTAPAHLRGIVIGIEEGMLDSVSPAIRRPLDGAMKLLRSLGAELRPVSLPNLQALMDLGGVISATEAASIHLEQMRAHPDGYATDLYTRMQSGLAMPAMHYLHAVRARAALLVQTQALVFSQCNALFAPALAQPVPTRDESRTETAADVGRIHGPMVRLTRPFSYLGLPVLTLPCGFDAAGMPVGFQLAGDAFAELQLLAIGMLYEESAGWHRKVPGVTDSTAGV